MSSALLRPTIPHHRHLILFFAESGYVEKFRETQQLVVLECFELLFLHLSPLATVSALEAPASIENQSIVVEAFFSLRPAYFFTCLLRAPRALPCLNSRRCRDHLLRRVVHTGCKITGPGS